MTLPGQTFGRKNIMPFIIVKDCGERTVIKNVKRKMKTGEIYFTTTLAESGHCYTAKDIYPLQGNTNVLYQDAQQEFDKIYYKE